MDSRKRRGTPSRIASQSVSPPFRGRRRDGSGIMSEFLSAVVSIAFHGLALAMVLYLISVGLSVTMGLMGFVNLAHGVFAMAGGYAMTTLMNRAGVPFALALAAAVAVAVVVSLVLE